MTFLNARGVKRMLGWLRVHYDIAEVDLDYLFSRNNRGRIFIVNRGLSALDISTLRISSIGLYFAKEMADGYLLTVEGTQMLGPLAKKNVLEVDKSAVEEWIRGFNLETDLKLNGYVIVKYNNDFYGCGRVKDGAVQNLIPKSRRIKG